jgi:hypothetical protein
MMYLLLKAMGSLLLAAMLSAPALADTPAERGHAIPGTINYVEGQVFIGNRSIGANSADVDVLSPDQSLTTQSGKAEVLLTPGVFARVGDNSSIEMVSPNLTNTRFTVEKGEVIVEVAEIHPENNLLVNEDGAKIRLQKTGLYFFDAGHAQFRVFDGQAMVQTENEQVKVNGGHEVNLNVTMHKTQKFDKKNYETDDLYRWSSLRSAYVAEASSDAAPGYLAGGWGDWYGGGWIGSGWYWNPWFSCYTFIPGDGIFYSPFGWGFYSPFLAYEAPVYFGGRYYHHFGNDNHAWGPGAHYSPGVRGGGYGNGFRPSYGFRGGAAGPGGGFRSGGSHAGGGFHGGGFAGGGGFHGGRGRGR